jgi:fermentation-respiration switch protein FrsA (DUF1100 family)
MRKKIRTILLVVVIVLVVLFLGTSYFIGLQIFAASTQLVTNEKTSRVEDSFWEEYNISYKDFCDTYKIEKIEIKSSYEDHIIPADYIYAKQSEASKNNKTVIMVHGLGGNRYTNYPIAEVFLDKGYNVLTYDQRSSNENMARYTTFGYLEKYDLIDCIDYAIKNAPDQIIGVWGTSFGGATAGLALGYKDTDQKVEFAVLDCPVSSMEWMIEKELKDMDVGIPVSYMKWCGNIVNRLKLGFFYKDADVGIAMSKVETPVLIINSKADTLTPYFMGKDIYDAIQGSNKMIWTVEDSKHVGMWLDYNKEYRDRVNELLKGIGDE